jgi:peptide/nickel transport system permease protein
LVLLRKLATLVPTVLLVSFLTYVLVDLLPGDAATLLAGNDPRQETIDAIREELNLNDPLPVRYVKWLGDVATGDFGRSFRTNQPVLEAIGERLPITLQIGLMALIFAIILSIPLGVISAYRANTAIDKTITTVSFGLLAIPNFVMALVLLYVFAVRFRIFPAVGWTRIT